MYTKRHRGKHSIPYGNTSMINGKSESLKRSKGRMLKKLGKRKIPRKRLNREQLKQAKQKPSEKKLRGLLKLRRKIRLNDLTKIYLQLQLLVRAEPPAPPRRKRPKSADWENLRLRSCHQSRSSSNRNSKICWLRKVRNQEMKMTKILSVSYTHLTLPTIRLV